MAINCWLMASSTVVSNITDYFLIPHMGILRGVQSRCFMLSLTHICTVLFSWNFTVWFIHLDPNGGNFLLMPDGRIGLIDYGATKRLTRNERLAVCLLYAALAREDEQKLFEMSEIGGYKSKYGKKEILMKLIQFGYNSWGKDITGGKNIQQFIDELKRQDPWEEVPDNFVMAQFMSIRLRSLALGMNHPVKCSDWWGPIAEKILEQEGFPYETWDYEQLVRYQPELNIQKYKFA
jgi:predicted unusual protein kinase regulating ubiquinone biosynthesis (AarF/ABC1/UbiB family)